MYKRKRSYGYRSSGDGAIDDIAYLCILALVFYAVFNPGKALIIALSFAGVVVIFIFLRRYLRKKHFDSVLNKLKNSNQEEYLKNFISRFGLEGGKKKGFEFRGHNFDWDRINDLKKIFKEQCIISNEKDIFALLKFYIQEKEESLTRESVRTEPQKLSDLSGSDFERLLYRLFEKMGYKVEHIGRSGDQGGDLIANNNGERILIQAKCYKDWSTGNDAVQQVVGAMQHYNCNRTMVITTSHFTPEAITLAKDNRTELVSKEHLQELLQNYLGESWY
jgi:HJR/Mrr/RecB family endonuclease